MRILLAEANHGLRRSLDLNLSANGFQVEHALTGEIAIALGESQAFDLILMDLDLPGAGGLEVLRTLRLRRIKTPVVILTASAAIDLKVKALAGGADDYVVKPVTGDELIARIRAVIRRCSGLTLAVMRVGELTIDMAAKKVDVGGRPTHLTGREYQLVELMGLRRGKPLTKESVLTSLYGGGDEPEPKIIDVFVCKIRRKLALAGGDPGVIQTVWGGGYLMADPDRAPMLEAA